MYRLCPSLLESVSAVTFSPQDGAGAEGAPPEAGAEAMAGGDAAAAGAGDAIAVVPMVRILIHMSWPIPIWRCWPGSLSPQDSAIRIFAPA